MTPDQQRAHVGLLVGGLECLATAKRLERLARERYGAYAFDTSLIRVVAVRHGYCLIVGNLTAVYRTAEGCEQMIRAFGTPPLTSREEIAPWR